MLTTVTDGMAILAIRYRFFDVLWALGSLPGLALGYVVLPLALIGWGIWAMFFSTEDEVATAPATPVAIEQPVKPNRAAPAQRVPSTFAATNIDLLTSNPPDTRTAHFAAAQAAVQSRQAAIATFEIKMVIQYDLQTGRALGEDTRDLMQSAVMSGVNSSDIGNFVMLASEKYKSNWSAAERETYETLRGIAERVLDER